MIAEGKRKYRKGVGIIPQQVSEVAGLTPCEVATAKGNVTGRKAGGFFTPGRRRRPKRVGIPAQQVSQLAGLSPRGGRQLHTRRRHGPTGDIAVRFIAARREKGQGHVGIVAQLESYLPGFSLRCRGSEDSVTRPDSSLAGLAPRRGRGVMGSWVS